MSSGYGSGLLLAILLALAGCATPQDPQPFVRAPLATQAGESVVEIPALIDGKHYGLEAMYYAPQGEGLHPLAVLTHGRNGPNPARRPTEINGLRKLARALTAHGYAVLFVVRRGYGRSDGPDAEFLDTPEESALAGAQDVAAAVAWGRTLPGVDASRIIVGGHSQGGWVALAAATLPMEGVRGVVNFSGATNFRGQPSDYHSPITESLLEKSARVLGGRNVLPMRWVYASNDNHAPATVTRWFNTFREAGGKGQLTFVGAVGHSGTVNEAGGLTEFERFAAEVGVAPPQP